MGPLKCYIFCCFLFKSSNFAVISIDDIDVRKQYMVKTIADVATKNFDFRQQTILLDRQPESAITNEFLKTYRGTVVLEITAYNPLSKQMVFMLSSLLDFLKLLKDLQPNLKGKKLFDHSAKIIIGFFSRSLKFKRIFEVFWRTHVTNVVLIMEINDYSIGMFSYFPYTRMKCGDTSPFLLCKWSTVESCPCSKIAFPDKMKMFYGCPMFISTTKLYHPTIGSKNDIEVVKNQIMELLEQDMRFTPRRLISEHINIGLERLNNATGALTDVITGAANISTISMTLGSERTDLLDYTRPYYQVELVWIAPPIAIKSGSWRLLSPMSWHLWLALLPFVLFVFSLPIILKLKSVKKFCTKCFKKVNKLRGVMFRSWAIMFGQPILVNPKKFRDYYVVSLWLWFTFVLRSAYQSTLIVALKTDSTTGNFNTLEDAIAAGYLFGGMSSTLDHFSSEPAIKDAFIKLSPKDFDNIFEKIQRGEKKFLLLMRRDYVLSRCAANSNFLTTTTGKLCVYVLPQPVLSLPLVMWLKHGSPLKRTLNSRILMLQEAGLVPSAPKSVPARNIIADTNHTPLTIHQLLGCIICLGVGSILSVGIFVLELLMKFKRVTI